MKKFILVVIIILCLSLSPNQSGTLVATDDVEPDPLAPLSDNGNC